MKICGWTMFGIGSFWLFGSIARLLRRYFAYGYAMEDGMEYVITTSIGIAEVVTITICILLACFGWWIAHQKDLIN